MGPPLTQLLHDLCEIDRSKEVPPTVLCDLLDLFFVLLAVGQGDGAGDDLAWWSWTWLVFGAGQLRILGEVEEAVPEEAKGRLAK